MIRCTKLACSKTTMKAQSGKWKWTWMFGWRCPGHLPGKVTP